MAFPTGPVDNNTIYTDEYGNTFRYDANVGSWEKYTPGVGEPVLTSGSTMFGDLIQTPSVTAAPADPGQLSINRLDDEKIQFKYQGRDFTNRGFEMTMGCFVNLKSELLISSDTLDDGSAFAQYGDTLHTAQLPIIEGFDAIMEVTSRWQRTDEIGSGENWADIPGETSREYEIREEDRGKFLRRIDLHPAHGGGTCGVDYEAISNPVAVTFQFQPIEAFVFLHTAGSGRFYLDVDEQTEIFRAKDDGNWELIESVAPGSGTIVLPANNPRAYAFESDSMTWFEFEQTDSNFDFIIQPTSKTPALTNLYESFSRLDNYSQDLQWLNTSNVTNMNKTFEDSRAFNGSVNFDVSNVTDVEKCFYEMNTFNQFVDWDMPKVENAKEMFRYCDNLRSANLVFGDKLEDASRLLEGCSEFEGYVDMSAATNCTNVSKMFYGCKKFTGTEDIKDWPAQQWVDTSQMFYNCTVFNQFIGDWDLSNVTNSAGMMRKCKNYNQKFHNSWELDDCTNMSFMFADCTSLSIDVSDIRPVSAENFSKMFQNVKKVSGLEEWRTDVEESTNMSYMFEGYQNSLLIGLDDWHIPYVTNLNGFFKNARAGNPDLRKWCVSRFPNEPYEYNSGAAQKNFEPQWGKCPPNFSFSTVKKVINQSRPNAPSGEGQAGDRLYAEYTLRNSVSVNHLWYRDGSLVNVSDPSSRVYQATGADVGKEIKCIVNAFSADGGKAEQRLEGYIISANGMRSAVINPYTVVTADNSENGLPVRVKLRFSGVRPVAYYKFDKNTGEFDFVAEMTPGSDKILDLPSGIYQWEGTSMTTLDYSDSYEGSSYVEWSNAFKEGLS